MKDFQKTLLTIIVGTLLVGAIFLMLKNNKKRSDNMKLVYEKNKEILKKYFESWEKEDIKAIFQPTWNPVFDNWIAFIGSNNIQTDFYLQQVTKYFYRLV